MQLVSTGEWLSLLAPTTPQLRFLSCLDGDVQSVQIAYETYKHDGGQLESLRGSALGEMNARVIHHAKTFVCAMRRVGRVLEMAEQRHFPREVAQVIKYQRKVTKAFFEQYVEHAEISEAAVKKVTGMREAIVTAAKLRLNRRSPDQPFGVIRMDFE